MTEKLSMFRNKLKTGDGENVCYNAIDTKINTNFLKEQAELLESILQIEKASVEKAKRIIV